MWVSHSLDKHLASTKSVVSAYSTNPPWRTDLWHARHIDSFHLLSFYICRTVYLLQTHLVVKIGVEPMTSCVSDRYSDQLSYFTIKKPTIKYDGFLILCQVHSFVSVGTFTLWTSCAFKQLFLFSLCSTSNGQSKYLWQISRTLYIK